MQPQFAILIGDRHVRIARQPDASGGRLAVVSNFPHDAPSMPRRAHDLTVLVERLATTIESLVPPRASGRMIIPAGWCLIHQVETLDRALRVGAAFEFERFSPVPLEELTCCCWQTDEATSFVVAVFTEPVQSLLSAIEQLGFTIESASVDLCTLADSLDPIPKKPTGLVFLDEHHACLLLPDSSGRPNRIVRTLRIPEEGAIDHVRRHMGQSAKMAGDAWTDWQIVFTGNRWGVADLARLIPSGNSAIRQLDSEETVQHLLEAVVGQNDRLDLRVDNLQSSRKWQPLLKQLERGALLALVLLLVLTVRFWWDGSRHAKAADSLQSEQIRLYQQIFPDGRVLPGLALRIQSERIKLEGLTERNETSDTPAGVGGMEAFALLHELTDRLPKSAKVNIEEVVLEQDGLRVAGLTTSHQVAGDWVQQLNESSLLRADPPRTKLRADATVEFRVQVKRVATNENP